MLAMTVRKRDGRGKTPRTLSATSATDLARLAEALATVTRELPERTTSRQLLAFLFIAFADASRREITLTDLRRLGGNTPSGAPVIGQSIERTLDTFREPRGKTPDALGWVTAVEDPDDHRRKTLHLTDDGIEAVENILCALRQGEPT